jgi:hypothetical protein
MVADATLVALSAARQALKNVMLVRTLRDATDFDEEWYTDAARRELHTLAEESEREAVRLTQLRSDVRNRRGRARTADDYRSADRRHLKRRSLALSDLAHELRRLIPDDAVIEKLIVDARLRALDEITAATASVPGVGRSRPATGVARSRALQALREELSDYAD